MIILLNMINYHIKNNKVLMQKNGEHLNFWLWYLRNTIFLIKVVNKIKLLDWEHWKIIRNNKYNGKIINNKYKHLRKLKINLIMLCR